jgi:copper oxidase (laccase) domain-containing protein
MPLTRMPGLPSKTGPWQHGALPAEIAAGSQENPAEVSRPEADALVSDGAKQALWVCSADCSPVLIGDRTSGRTAAIHAGWRGTAQGLCQSPLRKWRPRAANWRIWWWPLVRRSLGEVYQVSVEVGAAVGRTVTSHPSKADHRLIDKLLEMPQSP